MFLTLIGVLRARHNGARKAATFAAAVQIDLSRPRDRRIMGAFLAGAVFFLFLSAVGSYNTYEFSESVQFCGETCHGVMKPELATHDHGPHARVACANCHVGPGANWFVRSKLSGTYQVYAPPLNKYPRPIPTPIRNLRPAQETCEECHWPQKFFGNLDRTFTYFQGDASNSPYSIRLSIKIGGSDPTHGPVGGIHAHMMVGNRWNMSPPTPPGRKFPGCGSPTRKAWSRFIARPNLPTTSASSRFGRWTAWIATTVRPIAICRRTRPSTSPCHSARLTRPCPGSKPTRFMS